MEERKRGLAGYEVRLGSDGKWGIYLRSYNVRVAVFARSSADIREELTAVFDRARRQIVIDWVAELLARSRGGIGVSGDPQGRGVTGLARQGLTAAMAKRPTKQTLHTWAIYSGPEAELLLGYVHDQRDEASAIEAAIEQFPIPAAVRNRLMAQRRDYT